MDLKVSPLTVQAQAVDRLRNAILGQYFKPNDRLVETELCKLMGISRTSIREALRHLEAEKLVTTIPNRGPSVRAIGWDEAEEIYYVRGLLEAEAAALFTSRAGAEHLAVMRAALEEFAKADRKDDAIGRLNSTNRFYDVILSNCGNRIIRESLQGLHARVNFLRIQSMSKPGRAKNSLVEMKQILQAIEARDPKAARKAALAHVQAACSTARDVFQPLSST